MLLKSGLLFNSIMFTTEKPRRSDLRLKMVQPLHTRPESQLP